MANYENTYRIALNKCKSILRNELDVKRLSNMIIKKCNSKCYCGDSLGVTVSTIVNNSIVSKTVVVCKVCSK